MATKKSFADRFIAYLKEYGKKSCPAKGYYVLENKKTRGICFEVEQVKGDGTVSFWATIDQDGYVYNMIVKVNNTPENWRIVNRSVKEDKYTLQTLSETIYKKHEVRFNAEELDSIRELILGLR